MKTIGILGGGQLGCMLAESLHRWGATVRFYDPDFNAPGKHRSPFFTCAAWTDGTKLSEFFQSCDVVTYEFENVAVDLLDAASQASGVSLWPSATLLATTQNRVAEKLFFAKHSLPHAGFDIIATEDDLQSHSGSLEPRILKTARGGYDGKGQWMLRKSHDWAQCLTQFRHATGSFPLCVLEQVVPLWREASCIVARSINGHCEAFTIFENVHENHILAATLCPTRIPAATQALMQKIATDCAHSLNVVGLLTVEFFLSETPAPHSNGVMTDGLYLYINELAPRPHNSGHITRTACNESQFDAMARVLLGLPLLRPQMVNAQVHAMGNLMGELWPSEHGQLPVEQFGLLENINEVVLYGKNSARPGRKMGHFTLQANSSEQALEQIASVKKSVTGG